ncbi:MAG: bifunctional sulfate adenylyltransferase/adenylylsulfate kinase [Pyrinomonadaceae bacterium]
MTDTLLSPANIISPYGGNLVNLCVAPEALAESLAYAQQLPFIQLSERSLCDLELLACGAFSPLDQFMGQTDYERTLAEMRLAQGHLFPIPITLPVTPEENIGLDEEIALRDQKNEIVATMTVREVFSWNAEREAQLVFGTTDLRHPLIAEMQRWGALNISGPIRVLNLPCHYDFQDLRLTPQQTRECLAQLSFGNVVAFQTRNPLHRAHEEMIKRAALQVDGVLLLHPAVGLTKPGDIDHYTRVRTYRAMANHYDPKRLLLALLPLAMRMGGPREALWHALIRRNYGANYMIVGRDHASPGADSKGTPFYGRYAAQELLQRFGEEIGVKPLSFGEFVYLPDEDRYEEVRKLSPNAKTSTISGTMAREWYREGGVEMPNWFARREVSEVITDTHPPRYKQGFCVWFTGLSSAGKSTTAEILTVLLQECGRRVTLLDGDVVRNNLSHGLGFSKDDRDVNIRRIGFVASEIVRHHGAAVCAAVSPYRATRNEVRAIIGTDRFIEVYVNTPLEECEHRDSKGMYAKARRGDIKNFTGIDDPYEHPLQPELVLDTVNSAAEVNARSIIEFLRVRGFLR